MVVDRRIAGRHPVGIRSPSFATYGRYLIDGAIARLWLLLTLTVLATIFTSCASSQHKAVTLLKTIETIDGQRYVTTYPKGDPNINGSHEPKSLIYLTIDTTQIHGQASLNVEIHSTGLGTLNWKYKDGRVIRKEVICDNKITSTFVSQRPGIKKSYFLSIVPMISSLYFSLGMKKRPIKYYEFYVKQISNTYVGDFSYCKVSDAWSICTGSTSSSFVDGDTTYQPVALLDTTPPEILYGCQGLGLL
jgi:hypothetical protein